MYFSGQHGVMRIAKAGGTMRGVGKLKNWSYTSQQQTLDTTTLQDTDKLLLNGVRSASGQASLLYYKETISNVSKIGGNLISTGPKNYDSGGFGVNTPPQLCDIQLEVEGGGTIGVFCYVTSFAMTCSVGEVVSADISFEVHGAPYLWDF